MLESPQIVVNPAHGNEPYILGTAVALETSKQLQTYGYEPAQIIVPDLYGDRQRRIMAEEFSPDELAQVSVDSEFGRILRQLTFGTGGYAEHMTQLINNFDPISRQLKEYFASRNTALSIDVGARFLIDAPHRYFCFPVLLSELMNTSIALLNKEIGFWGSAFSPIHDLNQSHMQKIAERMAEIESHYDRIFIPQISTLTCLKDKYYPHFYSQDFREYGKTILTPPLKREISATGPLVEGRGYYAMFSGTGIDQNDQDTVFSLASPNLTSYIPPWVELTDRSDRYHGDPDFLEYLATKVKKLSPHLMSSRSISAITGRAGWGTGWQAQQLRKPWLVSDYREDDDPEIFFNIKSIITEGIGKSVTDDPFIYFDSIFHPQLTRMRANQRQTMQRYKEEFGHSDGIRYVGERLAADYWRRINEPTSFPDSWGRHQVYAKLIS